MKRNPEMKAGGPLLFSIANLALVLGCLCASATALAETMYTVTPSAGVTGGEDVYRLKTQWGSRGSDSGQFKDPYGVAVDEAGNIYVADYHNYRIQRFDSEGNLLAQWGSQGIGDGEFDGLSGVAVGESGNVYVADFFLHRIQLFDPAGTYLAQWGSYGAGDGQFVNPYGVAVDGSGNVYVADMFNDRIQKFDPSGNYLDQWRAFDGPSGITLDSSGNAFVANMINSLVQKFDSSGSYLAQWGSNGSGNGMFVTPHGVGVDSSDNVYVADRGNHRIQKFNSEGTYLTQWGSYGSGDGQFAYPTGLAVDADDNVLVIDYGNNRLQKFAGFFSSASSEGGSMSPPANQPVREGETASFTVTPNAGYRVASVDSSCGGAWSGDVYTTGPVWSDCTVKVTFAKETVVSPHTITASAGPNGSISPSGAVTVAHEGSQTFVISPDPGYLVTDVSVDGSPVGAVGSYTFSGVTADHRITAAFSNSPVFTWGFNEYGQLGDGTTVNREDPLPLAGLTDIKSIAASMDGSIALLADGTVLAWGSNNDGAQTPPSWGGTYTTSPSTVSGLNTSKAIAGGWFHSMALDTSGVIRTWGNNWYGQLGDGSTSYKGLPVRVNGLPSAKAIAGGGFHSLAMDMTGQVWAWGDNRYGELGDGTFNQSSVPVKVQGLNNVIAIAAGFDHSLALKSDGTVWTWGYYGDTMTFPSRTPGNGSSTPQMVAGLYDITSIAGGGWHSVARRRDGTVWSWGLNDSGQLGNGTISFSGLPVQATGLSGAVDVDAKCMRSVARKTDGTVWTWGTTRGGSSSSVPVQKSGLSGITAIAAGMDHTIALKAVPHPPLTITATAGSNGSISPAGNVTVNYGENQTFSMTPDVGYHVQDVLVDGASVGAVGSYSFSNVTKDHTIAADFSINTYTVTPHDGTRAEEMYQTQWGEYGSGNGQFSVPTGVAADGYGNVYVADTVNHRIQKFDSSGNYLAKWGEYGFGSAQFVDPAGIGTDSNGNVYVGDYSHRIQKFDPAGTYLTQWGSYGFDQGQFQVPSGIAVDSSDNIYVVDIGNHRLQKFGSSGNFLTQWGSFGNGEGQFYYPTGVAVDSGGNVYVADWDYTGCNYRIQKFDSSGTHVTQWASDEPCHGTYATALGVAADAYGNIYVSDANRNRIRNYDSWGTLLTEWGTSGSGAGQFRDPFGIAADSAGSVYVGDANNNRIQKFNGLLTETEAGGRIEPATATTVRHGEFTTFELIPDEGSHLGTASGCGGALSGTTCTTGLITEDCVVNVVFAINAYTVTPSAGPHGSIDPPDPQAVKYKHTASFAVQPDAGYHTESVSGCGGSLSGDTYLTGPITEDCLIQAVFEVDSYALTVITEGSGSGSVTSSPEGIHCGATCSATYIGGTMVTLTATPNADSVFEGWGGGWCAGTGSCTVSMDAAKTVTAAFRQAISVVSPDGGEDWRRGSRYVIRWNYAGEGDFVKIQLLKKGALDRTISSRTPIGSSGSGSFIWKISPSQTPGEDYTIKIGNKSNPSFFDTSNGTFTISR